MTGSVLTKPGRCLGCNMNRGAADALSGSLSGSGTASLTTLHNAFHADLLKTLSTCCQADPFSVPQVLASSALHATAGVSHTLRTSFSTDASACPTCLAPR